MRRYLAVLLSLVALPLAAQDFNEGEWEFKTQMTVPGLPSMEGFQLPEGIELPEGMQMPSFGREGMQVINRHCVTRASLVPPASPEQQQCKVTDQHINGGRVSWRIECATEQGRAVGIGQGQYSGTRMSATMQVQGNVQGLPITSNVVTEGRYIGACPAP